MPVTKETRSLLLNTKTYINFGRVKNMCEALTYLLENVFITVGTKLHRQIVGVPMGTSCAPVKAHLFLFFMRELLWLFFLMTKKLKLFKHLTLHLDIQMIFKYCQSLL